MLLHTEKGFLTYTVVRSKRSSVREGYDVQNQQKLGLTDIQRAQRYEVILSRKDWGLAEWRMVIFLDEASIIVSAKRGQQNISRIKG